MGDTLYEQFLAECVEDLQTALLFNGVNSLLANFEWWLHRNGHIKNLKDRLEEEKGKEEQ